MQLGHHAFTRMHEFGPLLMLMHGTHTRLPCLPRVQVANQCEESFTLDQVRTFMGFSASVWRGRVAGVALTLATLTLPPSFACLHKLHHADWQCPLHADVRVVTNIETLRYMVLEHDTAFKW
jgi:hypothetical protein